jgi:hypothetical protein
MSDISEDTSSDESLTVHDASSGAMLDTQFVAPLHTFRGEELWPFTHAIDLIFNQVVDVEDKESTYYLKFIFLHIKRGEATAREDRMKHLRPLAWNAERFQTAFLDWVESLGPLTAELKQEAETLYARMHGEVDAATAEAVGAGTTQKKTSLATQHGSSITSGAATA